MKKKTIGFIALGLVIVAVVVLATTINTRDIEKENETSSIETTVPETTTPETKAPETQPETKAPETQPETQPPETKAPDTQPETTVPETTTPETKAPETQPETKAPETQPETQPPETKAPETQPITPTQCNHQWPDWTITILPTSTKTGMMERVCPLCGAKETEVMPAEPQDGGGNIDKWGDDVGNWDTTGNITQDQFDGFVAYATSQGYDFAESTALYVNYDLNKSGTIFPSFAIINSGDSDAIMIKVWITPDNGSDDTRVCHNIDQLYEFFNLYKDR